MGSHFHQRRTADLSHHLPGGKTFTWRHQAAKIDVLSGGRIDPTADRRPQRGDIPGFQQRPDTGIKAAVAIVEA